MPRHKPIERIAGKEFRARRRITVQEVAVTNGVTPIALFRVLIQHRVSVRTRILDRLCAYFGCRVEKLVEYGPETLIVVSSSETRLP